MVFVPIPATCTVDTALDIIKHCSPAWSLVDDDGLEQFRKVESLPLDLLVGYLDNGITIPNKILANIRTISELVSEAKGMSKTLPQEIVQRNEHEIAAIVIFSYLVISSSDNTTISLMIGVHQWK